MATKAQLIQHGIDLGVPADRLTGTKVQIQQTITDYSAALANAAADTGEALKTPTQAPVATGKQPMMVHPVNAALLGGLLGAASHFWG